MAANKALRQALVGVAKEYDFSFHAPPFELCGDNGVMIAWAGSERLARGISDMLDAPARPRWPLDSEAPKAIGAGGKA